MRCYIGRVHSEFGAKYGAGATNIVGWCSRLRMCTVLAALLIGSISLSLIAAFLFLRRQAVGNELTIQEDESWRSKARGRESSISPTMLFLVYLPIMHATIEADGSANVPCAGKNA